MSAEPVSLEGVRILIVDDDTMSRDLLSRALENAGFNVVPCRDGVEALQILESNGRALLVLDYEMPELTGAQICEIIRNDNRPEVAQTPIVLLTAHSGEEHEVECLRAGADDFVTKPVNLAILKARIETQLRLLALREELQEKNRELGRWRETHERDLEAARLTQQAILPQNPPRIAGWNFAAQYHSLIQVGGDVYSWSQQSDGRLLFWIADATGHGASAALITTLTKLLFRHARSEHTGAARVMERVNRDFFSIFGGKSYMTAACLLLEPRTGRAEFAGAGHPPLLICRADGEVDEVKSLAPPMGIAKDSEIPSERLTFEVGDTFLLYTDGIDSISRAEERISPGELPRLLATRAQSAEAFLVETLRRVRERSGGEEFTDDLALIAGMRSDAGV